MLAERRRDERLAALGRDEDGHDLALGRDRVESVRGGQADAQRRVAVDRAAHVDEAGRVGRDTHRVGQWEQLGVGGGDGGGGMLAGLGKGIASLGKGIGVFLKSVGSGAGKLVISLAKGFAALGKALGPIGKGIGRAIAGILQGFAKGVMAFANPLVVGGLAVFTLGMIGLGAALRLAAPAFEAIAPVLIKVADVIGNVLMTAIKEVPAILREIGGVITAVGTQIRGIIDSIGNSIRKIGSAVKEVLDGISGVITAIGNTVSGVITSVADSIATVVNAVRGDAKAEAEAQVMVNASNQVGDWEKIQAQNAGNSWKDEWLTVLFSIPLVMAFIPGGIVYVERGFAALEGMPEWYQYTLSIIVAASFGVRSAIGFMKARK